jgi:hypothetical protein
LAMEAEQKTVFRGLHRSGALASHRRCAPPLSHFAPDSLRGSAPLFLKRRCGRTLGGRSAEAEHAAKSLDLKKEIAALEQGGPKEQAAAIMLQKERQVGPAFCGRACSACAWQGC